ncbi:TPA: AlwI family type II restriction endonuclease [Streptococcus suis]|nr:AlwI family type II restriction endonuclease [Streptococcus suis]
MSGLISFNNGLVNLNNKWIFDPLLNLLTRDFSLTGNEDYANYELSENSNWFNDITTCEILNISESTIESLYKALGHEFGTNDLTKVNNLIIDKREKEFRTFVETHFPVEKVTEILENIKIRNDEQVFSLVTENATVSTIYEYILTIAWYHLSENKNFHLHKAFQVSLDGNKLPLTHRGGGAGDIEIVTDDYALLVEATLMDANTQKRGEMEPVIRHSINFALENKSSQTIFIANDLDNNVLNIFRAAQFIQFNGTLNTGTINGLKIFALTTNELIIILQKKISDIQLLNTINNHSVAEPMYVFNNWRQKIINEIIGK